MREQARDWLQLDLASWAKKVDAGAEADTETERILARKTLAPWWDDPHLPGLRIPPPLERLVPAEGQQALPFWQRLDDRLRGAQTPT